MTRQSRQSQQSRIRTGLIRTDKKTDMKMKTRRQRYDNEDPSAGHDTSLSLSLPLSLPLILATDDDLETRIENFGKYTFLLNTQSSSYRNYHQI